MNDSETKLEPISTIVADSSTNSDHNNNNIKCRCGCVPNILSLFEMAALRDKKRREMKALTDNNNNNNDNTNNTHKNDDSNKNNDNNDDNNKTHKNDDDNNNNNNNNEIVDLVANLDTNVNLPLRIIGKNISSYLNNLNDDDNSDKISKSSVMTGILIGHGLGPKNPKEKNHLNDKYVDMALNAINEIDKNIIRPIITIAYTSRGHGDSTGWELTAASNPNQFTWMKLADDMVSLASKYQLPKFIACGSSMGAATSLWAAINNPDQVNAIIMMRPPIAWNDRLLRRKTLLSSASKCQEASLQGELHYLVIKGTAYSDLPSLEDYESYNKIKCPLLILAVEGDDSHPVSTAQAIKSMVSHAELHISENDKKAKKIWPNLIKTFVEKVININT